MRHKDPQLNYERIPREKWDGQIKAGKRMCEVREGTMLSRTNRRAPLRANLVSSDFLPIIQPYSEEVLRMLWKVKEW